MEPVIEHAAELARTETHRAILDAITDAIEAVHPGTIIPQQVSLSNGQLLVADAAYPLPGDGRVFVIGAGKPAGHAAFALERILGDVIDGGVVITDQSVDCERIEVIEGTHPLPSERNVSATTRLVDVAETATEDDLIIAILGGGGSALLCSPADGIPLEVYRRVIDDLLEAGASITELNAVRKHLSTVKGGQLARRLASTPTVALVFSDVVGDPLDVIASGPLAPDPTTFQRAIDVFNTYRLTPPAAASTHLERGRNGEYRETPGPEASCFDQVTHHLLATNHRALSVAKETLEAHGYPAQILSSRIEGESRDVGSAFAGIALGVYHEGDLADPPIALISGGETTVTVEGDGYGGPNQEFVLAAALSIGGTPTIVAAIDTDGIDGNSPFAGAIADGMSVSDRHTAREALDRNDATGYLESVSAGIKTGPTGTNVNDLRILLVEHHKED